MRHLEIAHVTRPEQNPLPSEGGASSNHRSHLSESKTRKRYHQSLKPTTFPKPRIPALHTPTNTRLHPAREHIGIDAHLPNPAQNNSNQTPIPQRQQLPIPNPLRDQSPLPRPPHERLSGRIRHHACGDRRVPFLRARTYLSWRTTRCSFPYRNSCLSAMCFVAMVIKYPSPRLNMSPSSHRA